MNERVDTLVIGDASTKLPVAGIFKIENGKITEGGDFGDATGLVMAVSMKLMANQVFFKVEIS